MIKITQVLAVAMAVASANAFADSDQSTQAAPPVIQLPAIACASTLSKVNTDYREYYDSRIDIAKHFVSDQVDALKMLRENIKAQVPAIRALMSSAADGKKESKLRAMDSVAQFAADTLGKASSAFWDSSYTTSSWSGGGDKRWDERMDTKVLLGNGDYGVAACSDSTFLYNSDMKPEPGPLKLCSILDLETGTIWGDTPLEALQLAGNKMDKADYIFAVVGANYPMCATAAGYSPISLSKLVADADHKNQSSTDQFLYQGQELFETIPPAGDRAAE